MTIREGDQTFKMADQNQELGVFMELKTQKPCYISKFGMEKMSGVRKSLTENPRWQPTIKYGGP